MKLDRIGRDIFVILLGTCIYAFGLVFVNIPNHLAEGGVTGITLIFRALFGINPAITTLVLNIPIIVLGGRILGRRSFFYTIIGTVALSAWLFIWQKVTFNIDLDHDLLISALIAGLLAGFGSGIIYRVGGTLFILDIVILTASLTYIDLKRMMYTLIFSYVFSHIVDAILDGGYSARGILVISNKSAEIAPRLMSELERGVSFLHGEGAYSGVEKKIIYMVVSTRELSEVKRIIHEYDEQAFVSVINVHEVEGEGFTYLRPKKKLFRSK